MTIPITMRAETPQGNVRLQAATVGQFSVHTGVIKSDRPEARAARPATIATAPTPARFPALLDESQPVNRFSAHSLTRGRNLLSEGYRVGRWRRTATKAVYMVETPTEHDIPWYAVTFWRGMAECECARVGLGGKPCCHIACIVHFDSLYPGLIAAADYDGLTIVTHWSELGYRQVAIGNGAEVGK